MSRTFPILLAATACAAALAGCSGQAEPPPASPTALEPGAAVGQAQFFGTTFSPCTAIELEGFPASLAKASRDYYEGPWCGLRGNERIYLWAYSRPLSPGQTPQDVTSEVFDDGQQLGFELVAQGYSRVCGSDPESRPVDTGYERADEASRIRIITAGTLAVSSGAAGEESQPLAVGAEPLSLRVVLSPSQRDPAVAAGQLAPPC